MLVSHPSFFRCSHRLSLSPSLAAASDSTPVNAQSALPAGKEKSVRVDSIDKIFRSDFFDNSSAKTPVITSKPVVAPASETSSALPEGFFDDPQMDARARKVEYVDKMEVEWDSFVKEMKQEATVRQKIATKRLNIFVVGFRQNRSDRRTRSRCGTRFERDHGAHVRKACPRPQDHRRSSSPILRSRWQKIEELHDAKDQRFKVKKKSASSEKKNDVKDEDDDVDDGDLEKELEGMYNWRQKRS